MAQGHSNQAQISNASIDRAFLEGLPREELLAGYKRLLRRGVSLEAMGWAARLDAYFSPQEPEQVEPAV